jgi:tetratricopeptide (TPR) repeat protein
VRDDREAPLLWAQDGADHASDAPFWKSEIFFARRLDAISENQLVGQISRMEARNMDVARTSQRVCAKGSSMINPEMCGRTRACTHKGPDVGFWVQAAIFCPIAALPVLPASELGASSAPNDSYVISTAAGALDLFGEEYQPLLALIDQALTLSPSSAYAWFWSGFLRLFTGAADTAIEHFEKSLRLDPRTPRRPFHQAGLGACYFFKRRFADDIAELESSCRQVLTYITASLVLAVLHAYGPSGGCPCDDRAA